MDVTPRYMFVSETSTQTQYTAIQMKPNEEYFCARNCDAVQGGSNF